MRHAMKHNISLSYVCTSGSKASGRSTHVWPQFEIRDTPLDVLLMGVIEMTIDNLLSVCQWAIQSTMGSDQYIHSRSHVKTCAVDNLGGGTLTWT